MGISKKYVGKTCVYCCIPNNSSTADHVLAKQFFQESFRVDLPKVPSCADCNNNKSKLEHYLATMLPFTANGETGLQRLSEKTSSRLSKNQRLHRELQAGMEGVWTTGHDGVPVRTLALPFDSKKIEKLYSYIARGLAFWHWKLLLPPDKVDVTGGHLRPEVEEILESLICMEAAQHIQNSFGDGAFSYEGVQAKDNSHITIWRMSFGAVLLGDKQFSTKCYATTASTGKALPLDAI